MTPTEINENIRRSAILVVDDKPQNIEVLRQLLRIAGYSDISSAVDSRSVLGMCAGRRYDLILLDVRMPHVDGITLCRQLRQVQGDDYLPILVMTAQTDAETRQQALAAGANDFITKPFEAWEVLQRIRNMLETRVYFNGQRQRADVLAAAVRASVAELAETQLEIVRRLGRAGEYRDNETGAHVVRMSKSCQLLARAVGLGEERAELILVASPMHDVGKIGIPDRILLKQGTLDGEDWAVMRTHAQIGADILSGSDAPVMKLGAEIALAHHEKWNGSGYPQGLAGEAIPLAGRIAAVCDVFDALTSARPYKPAWSVERAENYLREQRGVHFDPSLIDAFLPLIPEVVALRGRYSDEPAVVE